MVKYFSSLGFLVAVFNLVPIEGQCSSVQRDGLAVKLRRFLGTNAT